MVLFNPRHYLTPGQLPPLARKTSDDFQFEPVVMSRRIVIGPRCIREDSKSQLRRSRRAARGEGPHSPARSLWSPGNLDPQVGSPHISWRTD